MKLKRYNDFKKINEGIFWDEKDHDLLRMTANKYDLNLTKINDNQLLLGPKKGHELTIYLVNGSYKIKKTYYGSEFGELEDVYDLDTYLKNYDFDNKPLTDHKYSMQN